MKKLLITSVMAMTVAGAANASTYLNWDAYDQDTNPMGMAHLDVNNPGPGAEHNFNLIQGAINSNAAEFDALHSIVADWNKLLFGPNGDMAAGLFHDFYLGTTKDFADVNAGFDKLSNRISDMNHELAAGIANVAALSAVAVSDVRQGEVSLGGGYGYHNAQSAVAFGTAIGLTDNWSMNAGVGFNDYDVTVRAGTNVKFKLF